MTKLLNVLIVLLALILVVIIVYPQWKESRPISIRIGCDSTVASTVFIVTQEKQFFKNERITPEFIFYADPQIMLDELITDKITCAISPWGALLKKVDISQDSFKVLAAGEFRVSIPIDAILTSPASKIKIKELKDLKGKRFGYPPQVRELIPIILKTAGIKENEIKLTEISNSALVSALALNQLDAALLLEPERTAALNQGMAIAMEPILPKVIVAPFPAVAYVIKKDLMTKQKRIAYKLKMLLDGTVAFADANVEESRAMFINFFNLDKDIYKNCYLPQFQKLVEINKGSVISLMTKMADTKVLSKSFDVQPLFPEASQFRQ